MASTTLQCGHISACAFDFHRALQAQGAFPKPKPTCQLKDWFWCHRSQAAHPRIWIPPYPIYRFQKPSPAVEAPPAAATAHLAVLSLSVRTLSVRTGSCMPMRLLKPRLQQRGLRVLQRSCHALQSLQHPTQQNRGSDGCADAAACAAHGGALQRGSGWGSWAKCFCKCHKMHAGLGRPGPG